MADYNSDRTGSNIDAVLDKADNLTQAAVGVGGNVGIGTASPSAKLDVTGGVNIGDTYGLGWGTGNEKIVGVNTGNSLRFVTNNSERARIDSSGNLLVGTTSNAGASGKAVFNGGVANTGYQAVTETISKGASGTFTTITISFEGNNENSTGIMEVQMGAFNNKGLDYCVTQYSGGSAMVLRNNATSGVTTSVTGTPSYTGTVWTLTITGSFTHPVVTAKCTAGGLATGFGTTPNISLS